MTRFDDDIYGADPAHTGKDGWSSDTDETPEQRAHNESVSMGCLIVFIVIVLLSIIGCFMYNLNPPRSTHW